MSTNVLFDTYKQLIKSTLRDDIFCDCPFGECDESAVELYEPIRQRKHATSGNLEARFHSALWDEGTKIIVILGDAGSGKSTFLRYYFGYYIDHYLDDLLGAKSQLVNRVIGKPLFTAHVDVFNQYTSGGVEDLLYPSLRTQLHERLNPGFFSSSSSRLWDRYIESKGLGEVYRRHKFNGTDENWLHERASVWLENDGRVLKEAMHVCNANRQFTKSILIADNADLTSAEVQVELWKLLSFWSNTSGNTPPTEQLEFDKFIVCFRPETWMTIKSSMTSITAEVFSVEPPDENKMIIRRARNLRRHVSISKLSFEDEVAVPINGDVQGKKRTSYKMYFSYPNSSVARMFECMLLVDIDDVRNPEKFLIPNAIKQIYDGLCNGSTRRAIHIRRNIISHQGVQNEVANVLGSSFRDSGRPAKITIRTYTFLDAVICGSNDFYQKHMDHDADLFLVVNLFNVDFTHASFAEDMLAGPCACHFLLRGVSTEADLIKHLEGLGFSEQNCAAIIEKFVQASLIHRVGKWGSRGEKLRIERDFLNAHNLLLSEAAYIDNMAQAILARRAGGSYRLTVGHCDEDFVDRTKCTVEFIRQVKSCEAEMVSGREKAWIQSGIPSVYKRVAMAYRYRLGGLLASRRLPEGTDVGYIKSMLQKHELCPGGEERWRGISWNSETRIISAVLKEPPVPVGP